MQNCRYFLVIKEVVDEATLELGNETNSYECGKIYGSELYLHAIINKCMITIFVYVGKYCIVEVANSLNAPEGFLVQARDGTEENSTIIGTFLHPDVVRERTGHQTVNDRILQCKSHINS